MRYRGLGIGCVPSYDFGNGRLPAVVRRLLPATGGWVVKLLVALVASSFIASLLVACAASPVRHPGQVSAGQGGSIELAGARLLVPPGAVSRDGDLRASTVGAPPRTAQPMGTSRPALLSSVSAPVHFTLAGARIIRLVRITVRVPHVPLPPGLPAASRASAVWLSYYNSAARRWQAVPSRYDPASGTVTAQVRHLSWWMAWTWDWAGTALRLRQALSAFGSGRAPATSCPSVPPVTVTSLGEPDAPLIGCVAKTGPGTLTASLTNNRGVSMVMTGVPSDATPGPASYTGLAAYLADRAFREALARRLGGAILPPAETITYTVPLHGAPEVFIAEPTLDAYLLDLAITAGQQVFGSVTKDYGDCVLNTVLRSEVPALADAPATVVTCLPVLARSNPATRDLAKALGKRFSAVLALLTFDVKTLLQDYDLSYDAVRGVRGRVQIDRPAVEAAPGAPPTQQSPAPFAVTSSSPTSGPASGGTRIVIHGSGFSSVTDVVMNSIEPPLPIGNPNYNLQNLHPSFSVVSDSEIDVTTTAGATGFTYEIDFFTPTDEYFRNTFPGIPLFTYK